MMRRGPLGSGTAASAGGVWDNLASDPADVIAELLSGAEFLAFAAIDLVDSLPGGGAQPAQFGAVFLLPPLHQAQALPHNLTGVAVAARADLGLNKTVETIGEVDIASWHGSEAILAALAKIANGRAQPPPSSGC